MPVSFFPIIIAVSVTMGQALAWPIYLFGHRQAYDAKIDILASLNLGWLYLALLVVYYTKQIVSQHASYVRNHANVSLPNHTVHKVFIPDGGKQLPYVLLEEDGMVGKANRAQRGFENLMEYLPMYLVYLCAIGFVYPFPRPQLSLSLRGHTAPKNHPPNRLATGPGGGGSLASKAFRGWLLRISDTSTRQ